jgi:hypothetical protein
LAIKETKMNEIQNYIGLLIPILVLELVLMIAGLVDLSKRRVRYLPKWGWLLIILFIQLIGPITYFLIGREDE